MLIIGHIDFVLTMHIQMFMRVKLNSLFDREMKVYHVTQVLKQGINIKTMCPNYIFKHDITFIESLSRRTG